MLFVVLIVLRDGDELRPSGGRAANASSLFQIPGRSIDRWRSAGRAVSKLTVHVSCPCHADLRRTPGGATQCASARASAHPGVPLFRSKSLRSGILRCAERMYDPSPPISRSDLRHYLCRSGGDCDRERTAVRGGAGAHGELHGVAGVADRHERRPQCHQPLGVRSSAGA